MNNLTKIELGEVYRDVVSGLVGVAVAKPQYLNDPVETAGLEAHATEGGRVMQTFSSARLKPETDSDMAGQYL